MKCAIVGLASVAALTCDGLTWGEPPSMRVQVKDGSQVALHAAPGTFAFVARPDREQSRAAMRESVTDFIRQQRDGLRTSTMAVFDLGGNQSEASLRAAMRRPHDVFVTQVYEDSVGNLLVPHPELVIYPADGFTFQDVFAALDAANLSFEHLQASDIGNVAFYAAFDVQRGEQIFGLAARVSAMKSVKVAMPDFATVFAGPVGGDTGPIETPELRESTDRIVYQIPGEYGYLQWAYDNLGQFVGSVADADLNIWEAWQYTSGAPWVTVTVFDVGVEKTHEDFTFDHGRTWSPLSILWDQPDAGEPDDEYDYHGTHVAGLVSANHNAAGIYGAAPGCSLTSAKFWDTVDYSGYWTSRVVLGGGCLYCAAINDVTSQGANIVIHAYGWTVDPLSWPASHQPKADAITQSTMNGVVHFGAMNNAGSERFGQDDFPVAADDVIGIGAMDWTGQRASFSGYGFGLEFLAPGVNVLTTDMTGSALGSAQTGDAESDTLPVPGGGSVTEYDYDFVSGCSYAAPLVGGMAALMMSWNGPLNKEQVMLGLRQSALPTGGARSTEWNTDSGWGLPRADVAINVCLTDFDANLDTNGADLSILLARWGTVTTTEQMASDLDGDHEVGGADLAIFLAAWGACD